MTLVAADTLVAKDDGSAGGPPAAGTCTLPDLLRYFLWLGATGFGGPVALVGYMQRDLVERRRWFTPEEYREGLALAQLAPGPLAAQLAIYLGWARGGAAGGALGGALVGLAFVVPSFLMVLAVAILYLRFGGLPWMQGAFYGVGAAVVAVIARSALKLTRLTLGGDRLLWTLAAAAALVTVWTESEIVWVFVGAGLLTLLVRAPPVRLPGGTHCLGLLPPGLLTGIAGSPATASTLGLLVAYFTEAGAFVFGSGLAIVPFLHAGVVREFGWLDERQFLDAVAVAMITPGPVVITVAFIGYLVAGAAGAAVAALGTFLPCYLFTVIPAPHFHRIARSRALKAFVDGVTAAATGAIAGASYVLGRRALVDATAAMIALGALVVVTRARRVPEPLLIAAAGALGVLLAGGEGAAGGGPAGSRTPSVVFVCEHGSAKSLVAATLFDQMAKERGLQVRAVSRGLRPDPEVPAPVVRALADDGFDVGSFRPLALAEADVRSALRVVAIGVDLEAVAAAAKAGVVRWDGIPPVSTRYPEARAAIEARLTVLLREIGE